MSRLQEALRKGRPEIFNTDQGTQFTSEAFTGFLEQHGIRGWERELQRQPVYRAAMANSKV